MSPDETWVRYGAAAGVVAVILYVIGFLIMPRPPAFDAPSTEVVAYVTDDQSRIQLAIAFYAAAAWAFVWFVGTLTGVAQVAESDNDRLSRIAFGATVAVATLFVVVLAVFAAITLRADEGIALAPEVTHALYDVSMLIFAAGAFVFGGLFVALALLILRTSVLPAWVAGLAGVTSVTIALWIGGVFTTTGAFNTVDGLFGYWLGIVAFLAWTLVASVLLVDAVGRGGGTAAPRPGRGDARTPGAGPPA